MSRALAILTGVLAVLAVTPAARATTIEDVCPSNPTPPDPCLVTSHVTVASGSVLDAGTRTLVVTVGKSLDVGTGTMTIRAAKITLEDGARVRGTNGRVTLEATGSPQVSGDIELLGASAVDAEIIGLNAAGEIRAEGALLGGNLSLEAGTSVTLTDVTAPGGDLGVSASGPVTFEGAIDLSDVFNGGEIGIYDPDHDVVSNGTINLSGRDPQGGSGGTLSIFARNVTLNGTLLATGSAAHNIGNEGGLGGTLEIEASGTIRIVGDAILIAGNGGPGGQAFLRAGGDVHVGVIDLHTLGDSQGFGGAYDSLLEISAQGSVAVGSADVNGAGGGSVYIKAGGATTLGNISARGTAYYGGGGYVDVDSGDALTVSGNLIATGPDYGGSIVLEGCDVTVENGTDVKSGANDGDARVTAHEHMTIAGSVESEHTALRYRAGGPVPVITGTVTPPVTPVATSLAPCTSSSVCGNGTVELPEECDDGAANGTAGDPCSATCTEYPPALRIPGGGSKPNDCAAEWSATLNPGQLALDRAGAPRNFQACTDGDPVCDADPTPGICQFHVWQCLGSGDARLGCAAVQVTDVEVRRPTPAQGASARGSLSGALGAVGLPIGPGEQCTRRMRIDVPAGKVLKLQTRARLATGKTDGDALRLRCLAR